MSLFGAIRRLYRKDKFQMEDFHTEIVAQVIRNSRELAIRWLRDIRAANSHMTNVISIDTQVPFSALEENEPGSRVDMVIQLRGSDVRQIVFIESKIDSKENPGQLSKYAGVIRKLQADFNYIKIVYVTRDFEMLPRDAPADVITPCRWFQFYDVLKDHTNRDGLAEQLKLFMEENRMSQRNQFTALDSLALGNFRAAKSLMDETLWSGVSDKFKNILGAVSPQKRAITSLREWGGYVMNATFGNADFYCHLGYYLPNEDPTEFPWVGVWLSCKPKSAIRKKVLSAFRNFLLKGNGWKPENLDDEKAWSQITKGRHLQTFMAEPDHIKAIKDYFLNLLDDVKRFKSESPELPWSASGSEAEDER